MKTGKNKPDLELSGILKKDVICKRVSLTLPPSSPLAGSQRYIIF